MWALQIIACAAALVDARRPITESRWVGPTGVVKCARRQRSWREDLLTPCEISPAAGFADEIAVAAGHAAASFRERPGAVAVAATPSPDILAGFRAPHEAPALKALRSSLCLRGWRPSPPNPRPGRGARRAAQPCAHIVFGQSWATSAAPVPLARRAGVMFRRLAGSPVK